jgi:hypothetical protein
MVKWSTGGRGEMQHGSRQDRRGPTSHATLFRTPPTSTGVIDSRSSERISSIDQYLTFILIGGGLQVLIFGFFGTGKHAPRYPEYRNVEVSNMPHLEISPPWATPWSI